MSPGGQDEMAFAQRAGAAELFEDVVCVHAPPLTAQRGFVASW
jgi:hypothetical protein